MTSKQRAKLRALANSIEPIILIGKEGITDNLLKQVDDALTARELIKGQHTEALRAFSKRSAAFAGGKDGGGACAVHRQKIRAIPPQ